MQIGSHTRSSPLYISVTFPAMTVLTMGGFSGITVGPCRWEELSVVSHAHGLTALTQFGKESGTGARRYPY